MVVLGGEACEPLAQPDCPRLLGPGESEPQQLSRPGRPAWACTAASGTVHARAARGAVGVLLSASFSLIVSWMRLIFLLFFKVNDNLALNH